MKYLSFGESSLLLGASFVVALLGAAFTYVVLEPTIGFDDANITQIYGRHIAQGHGYVYNIGGERVEGSTSILWTLINVAGYWSFDHPEPLFMVIGLGLTTLTIFYAGLITQELAASQGMGAPLATIAMFLTFPSFFGWMVWSLMDTGLWIFLIMSLFLVLVRLLAGQRKTNKLWLLLVLISAALPLTRPEGVALTTGLTLIYLARNFIKRDGTFWIALTIGASGVVSAVCATLWRLSYFGYPVPNTFYAKTSPEFVSQFLRGIRYILSYLEVGHNVLLVGLLCIAAAMIMLRGTKAAGEALLIIASVLSGAVLLYALLGGDHFGSHRFLLFTIPLGLPVIAAALRLIVVWDNQAAALVPWSVALFLALPFVLVGVVSGRAFVHDQGGIGGEFSIAEDGRKRGVILSALPESPVVGVVTAGGVRMGYTGPVQDLLALNWAEMAHAESDGEIAQIPNHTGFNQNVFWKTPPDIFIPRTAECPNIWVSAVGFMDQVTDYVSQTAKFQNLYDTACYNGLVFHVSMPYLARLSAGQTKIPFEHFTSSQ